MLHVFSPWVAICQCLFANTNDGSPVLECFSRGIAPFVHVHLFLFKTVTSLTDQPVSFVVLFSPSNCSHRETIIHPTWETFRSLQHATHSSHVLASPLLIILPNSLLIPQFEMYIKLRPSNKEDMIRLSKTLTL